MSRHTQRTHCLVTGFPRSRGDEPMVLDTMQKVWEFSPLTRG